MGCGPSKETLINNLNSQFSKLEADKTKLTSEKSAQEKSNSDNHKLFSERLEEKKKLEHKEHKFSESVKKLKEEVEKLQIHIQDPEELELRHKVEHSSQENSKLVHEITEQTSKKQKLDHEVHDYKVKVHEIHLKVKESEENIEDLDEKIAKITGLQSELKGKKERKSEVQDFLEARIAELASVKAKDEKNKKDLKLSHERRQLRDKKAELLQENEGLAEVLRESEEIHGQVQHSSASISEKQAELARFTVTDEEKAKSESLTASFVAFTEKVESLREAAARFDDVSKDLNELNEKKQRLDARLAKVRAKIAQGNQEKSELAPILEPAPEDELDGKELKKTLKDLEEKRDKKLKKIEEHERKISKKLNKHGHLFG